MISYTDEETKLEADVAFRAGELAVGLWFGAEDLPTMRSEAANTVSVSLNSRTGESGTFHTVLRRGWLTDRPPAHKQPGTQ